MEEIELTITMKVTRWELERFWGMCLRVQNADEYDDETRSLFRKLERAIMTAFFPEEKQHASFFPEERQRTT